MRTRKHRQRLSFMVISEITVAVQLLLMLPPRAVGAAPVAVSREEGVGAALLVLAAPSSSVTAPPSIQEPIEVNRTVPEVEPPPTHPTFSPIPTDEEISKARVFGAPLVPEEGESDAAENQALAQAIMTYLSGGDSEALEPLEGVVTTYPRSRWRVAVQANAGSWYRKKGYFTRAERNLRDAWRLGKESTTEDVRRLAEFAAGELMTLHMRFGQLEPLEALVTDFAGRKLSGGITETLAAAEATVWSLRNDHKNLVPSGALALERIRHDKHQKAERRKKNLDAGYRERPFERHPEIERFPAKHEGASLPEIQELSARAGLGLQMARRESSAVAVPLPAVVHLKQGHFTALVEERGGRFRLDDPILGGEVWMSREAFEEETSGYFLVESGALPPGWRKATPGETEQVRGKCFSTSSDGGGTRPQDPKQGGCGNSCSQCPMAQYTFHLMLASLSIFDTPVGYSPPRGPESRFQVTYNQREGTQPPLFTYSNLGPRWTFDWMSFLEDDPTAQGAPVERYVRGGGREKYEGFAGNASKPQQDVRAVLRKTSTDPAPIVYQRELPDGSVEVYSLSDGGTSPRRIFMTEWRDPQGNKLTFSYESQPIRLVAVQDALGQVTALSYELAGDALKITKVTDPFSRSARFEYDEGGRLVGITDPAGIRSEFEYGDEDFILAMKTPYGKTTFRQDDQLYGYGGNAWVEATDPLGGTERVEKLLNASLSVINPAIPPLDPVALVPAGFTGNSALNYDLAVYYSKLVMSRTTTSPPHPTEGEVARWRLKDDLTVSSYQMHSRKQPLEIRVWYGYEGEVPRNGVGPTGRPSKMGRVLDDGTSQIHRYEYGSKGQVTRSTDPLGRETVYEYAANETDLLRVKQRNGTGYDILQEMTYNTAHQPQTVKDPSGKTTTYTYNGQGQVETITTPSRAGINENRTTRYVYDANGYLQSVTGPAMGATTRYTYDGLGRTRTVTDSEEYVLTFDYDVLDRQVKTTYPDGTFEETAYDRLDPSWSRDRLGRWTHRVYDALRRVTATTDALGRTVSQVWCSCGSLDALVDGNGNRTEWERDVQGKVIKETRADGSEWDYVYESTTSRLKTVTDPKGQVKNYGYLLDDNLQGVSYTNEEHETPNVGFTYDSAYNRVKTMVDGTGTTTYGYHPVGSSPGLGAGRLQSVDGPLANDVITYGYDELGRVTGRAIDGVVLGYAYDALGRIQAEQNALGLFYYEYDGVTSRLRRVTNPNGQTTSYGYYPNSGDHRLQEIHHRKPNGTTLSRFAYTYDAVGNIKMWTQQQDENAAKAYDFEYDRADQLKTAVWRTTDFTPSVLKRYAYAYDSAGNRTGEQIDDAPTLSAYDNMNRLLSQLPGGSLRFAGTLNEAATVTVQGAPAEVSSTNKFQATTQIATGTSQVVVKAKDYAGNERTNTYKVSASGSSKNFTFDDNGNMSGDGTRTFEWDAENQLIAVKQGSTTLASFTYDGSGRRATKTDIATGVTHTFLYDDSEFAEERLSTGTTYHYYYALEIDEPLARVDQVGTVTYYTRDHLGSIAERTDASGTLLTRRMYDPWGNLLSGSSTESGFAFTGREWEPSIGLYFYRARYYDPSVGRFVGEDPIGFKGGDINLYAYVRNNPLNWTDPSGQGPVDCLKAIADLIKATQKVKKRTNDIYGDRWGLRRGGKVDPGHLKALKNDVRQLEDALQKVIKHCACYAAAAAAIAAAEAALEAAGPYLLLVLVGA